MLRDALIALLNSYLNKSVRIESFVDGKNLGGEGYLTEVLVENDEVWVCMDWGFSWIVRDDQLQITEVPSDTPPYHRPGV